MMMIEVPFLGRGQQPRTSITSWDHLVILMRLLLSLLSLTPWRLLRSSLDPPSKSQENGTHKWCLILFFTVTTRSSVLLKQSIDFRKKSILVYWSFSKSIWVNWSQPESIRVNLSQPETTWVSLSQIQVNLSQSESTWVNLNWFDYWVKLSQSTPVIWSHSDSTRVNHSQPKSFRLNPSQSKSIRVYPSKCESTQFNWSQTKSI